LAQFFNVAYLLRLVQLLGKAGLSQIFANPKVKYTTFSKGVKEYSLWSDLANIQSASCPGKFFSSPSLPDFFFDFFMSDFAKQIS
jgi:hypothetical protein